jgi:hypothetical protein
MTTATPVRRRARTTTMRTDAATIQGAIELVAARQARRVTLCGLRFGERLLPRATEVAARLGVELTLDRGSQGASAIVVTLAGG